MRFALSLKRRVRALCVAGLIWLAIAQSASACPMCKLANETNSRLPRAYMYSILFMMGMPATLATAFGISFYRLSRKAAQSPQDDLEGCDPRDMDAERE